MDQVPREVNDETADVELMRRLAEGDMAALAVLVRRHQSQVRALAYRLLGREDVADDVAQETFLRLYRSAPRYEPSAALPTLLHRIVVNLCLDWLKRKKPLPWPAEEALAAPDSATDGELVREERRAAIRDEIANLPERQRVAIVLHRFENLTHTQIAAVTGWSESAVESLLVRAYARLREKLRTWIES